MRYKTVIAVIKGASLLAKEAGVSTNLAEAYSNAIEPTQWTDGYSEMVTRQADLAGKLIWQARAAKELAIATFAVFVHERLETGILCVTIAEVRERIRLATGIDTSPSDEEKKA